MIELTPDQYDALLHYGGQVVLREGGDRWFPKGGTLRALMKRGLVEVTDEGRPGHEVLLTDAGREAAKVARHCRRFPHCLAPDSCICLCPRCSVGAKQKNRGETYTFRRP